MGWRRAIQIFDETVTSLEMAAVRNADGEVVRAVIVPVMPVAFAGAGAPTNAQAQAFYLQSQAARAVAVAAVRPVQNYRPTDADLKEYLLKALKYSRNEKYRSISDDAVLNRNMGWTWQQIRSDINNLADRDALDESGPWKRHHSPGPDREGRDGRDDVESNKRAFYEVRGRNGRGNRERSRSRSRGSNSATRRAYSSSREKGLQAEEDAYRSWGAAEEHRDEKQYAYSATTEHRERSRSGSSGRDGGRPRSAMKGANVQFDTAKVTCYNCGGNHSVFTCQSKTCGRCKRVFESVQDRKVHYMDVHKRTSTPDEPRAQRGYFSKDRGHSPARSHNTRSSYQRSPSRSPYRKSYSAEHDDSYDHCCNSNNTEGH